MSNTDIVDVVNQLINKAKGYGPSGSNSGGVAEAANRTLSTAPKADEAQKETNAANSGTHPKTQKTPGQGKAAGSGADFKDGGPEEDEIKGVSGPSGRAPQGHAGALKHEGGGQGPNHPGTATSAEKSETVDLEKDHSEDDPEEKDEEKKDEPEEKEEKSKESGDVFLDVDEFFSELVNKSVAEVSRIIEEKYAGVISKSQESEYVEAGLAKSVAATLERVEELEKAFTNVSKGLNIRKSLLRGSDIKGVKNDGLEGGQTMSKSEVASKLLDLQMSGTPGVDQNMVIMVESTGDYSRIPDAIKSKIGLVE